MKELKVTLGGETKTLQYKDGESILECALRHNLNAPYSCMEGVCTACIAMVEEGQLDFPKDTILTDEEAAEGKTLTCQAKFASACPRVAINYDKV